MSILHDRPEFYLDETQSQILRLSGKWFSGSTIYRQMIKIGFSLKVAYEQASQRDEEERAAWRSFLLLLGPDLDRKLIFVDKTYKIRLLSLLLRSVGLSLRI
jgi:hypothetical protein